MRIFRAALVSLLAASPVVLAAGAAPGITQLKDLHVTTTLVAAGKPRAVIVSAAGDRYAAAVQKIQAAVRKASGTALPVRRDAPNPEDLLKASNVIALGNMSTNPFIEHMYRQWYVLLDLKYPGKGGYVVRSCHNPYGTGHNVIWIGGSDDAGVAEAARVFAGRLTRGDPLKVGWLMEIALGEGLVPPRIGDDVKDWTENVFGWRDSYREISGQPCGEKALEAWGWNPISIAGVLYYMTGKREYLELFRQLAIPDPGNVPEILKTDQSIDDPLNPLVKNYHYHAHLVDCVWDLIEESPLLTNRERLHITNKLVEHYDHFSGHFGWQRPFKPHSPSRHGAWHTICIYTTARYMGKYYPGIRPWAATLERARKTFGGFIGNPTWGEADTLVWINTSTEPVFEFFMLDGADEFVSSGTARTMMSAIEILWSGRKIDVSNKLLSLGLLTKSAYLLKDGRYVWLARHLGYDPDVFRIGQSFWPPESLPVGPPDDLVNRVSLFPLARQRWHTSGKTVPAEEAFQILTYRSGLTGQDDFLHIDGFMGGGRNPYHVNALYEMRLGSHTLVSGYANQVQVWRNGMVAQQAAKAAALKKRVGFGAGAYVHTQVPNMPFSSWDRHVFFVGGRYVAVVDALTAREPGTFEVRCGWHLLGSDRKRGTAKPFGSLPQCVRTTEGTVLSCAQAVEMADSGAQTWEGRLVEGGTVALHNLLYHDSSSEAPPYTFASLGPRASVVQGKRPALVAVGPCAASSVRLQAAAGYIAADRVLVVDGVGLRCGQAPVFTCDKPLTLAWRLDSGTLEAQATEPCTLTLGTRPPQTVRLQTGRYERKGLQPDPAVGAALERGVAALSATAAPPAPVRPAREATRANWQPRWEASLKGRVAHIAAARRPAPMLWVAADDRRKPDSREEADRFSRLSMLSPAGKTLKTLEYDSRIMSLWPAADSEQARSFAVLAGFRDDMLRALSAQGRLVWEQRAQVHASFKIAENRYQAPWFSDPNPPRNNRGIRAIRAGDFWQTGEQAIALARPCTVEFREFSGKLINRLRTDWGNNSVFAMLNKTGLTHENKPVRWLLLGREYAGNPRVSGYGAGFKARLWAGYAPIERGATWISGWRKRRLWHLLTADLDGDGIEEVIRGIGGIWNDVAVHRGAEHEKCVWSRSFGPGHMAGLVVTDLTGDGKQEVVVVMSSGWVCVFNHKGDPVWQKKLQGGAREACAAGRASLAVGCRDGTVVLLNARGDITRRARLDGAVRTLSAEGGSLFGGTEHGQVACLPLP